MLMNLDSVPASFKNYIKQVDETDVLQALRLSGFRSQVLIHSIPDEKGIIDTRKESGRYAKFSVIFWTLKGSSLTGHSGLPEMTKPISIRSTRTVMLPKPMRDHGA